MIEKIQSKALMIGNYGCYFLSLLAYFNCEDVFGKYDYYISKGWMGEDCYVKNPLAIVEDLSGKSGWSIKKSMTFDRGADIIVAYYYNPSTKLHHFVLHDNNNQLLFDPLGKSNTVANGSVESYRLFYN